MADGEVKSAIQEGNRQFMAAFARGDTAGIAALYAVGAQLLPPRSDFVKGADATRKFWQGAIDMGIGEAKLDRRGGGRR
jgi:ketosteroid isomerase-like protein